jgi:hypothetical protein
MFKRTNENKLYFGSLKSFKRTNVQMFKRTNENKIYFGSLKSFKRTNV